MSENHQEIRDAVRVLCNGFPGEYWRRCDRDQAYPTEFVKALTDAGFLAVLIPEEYGGSGLGLSEAAAILGEIHQSGCNGGACHAQMYIMGAVLRHGSDEQKKEILPNIASGKTRLQAFGVTEPTSGTDTSRIRTTAIRNGDNFVINGQKVWTSRAEHSDLMLILARTKPRVSGKNRHDGMSIFIVDMLQALEQKTLTIKPLRAMLNHSTTEVFFDEMLVPATNLIGEEGKGFRYLLDGLNAERLLISAEAIGDARWFIQKACNYARERRVFDRPIGQNQGIQFPVARVHANTEAADLMLQKALQLFDAEKSCGGEVNIAKLLSADASWAAADMCMQTHGGFGFAEEYDIERKFRETRLFQVAPISTNLILSYIAEHILGLPRSF